MQTSAEQQNKFDNNRHLDDLLVAVERFELVAKATHDVIWDWDLVRNTVWWNEGIQHIFGYSNEDFDTSPQAWYERIHPDDQENVIRKIHKVIESGETNWADYYRFRRADGTYAYVHDRGYTIQNDGKAVRMVGSMMDISERLHAEQAKIESEETLKFATEASGLGTWSFDPITRKITANEKSRELYGYPEEIHFETANIYEFVHPEDKQRIGEAIAQALDPVKRATYDVRYRTIGAKDKVLRWLHCKGKAYFNDAGTPYRFAGISRDITEEVQNQERMRFADQQAAMTIEGSGAGSFMVNLVTDEIIYSPAMARILSGREDSHITRRSFVEHVHPDDRLIRQQAYADADATGNLRYETRFIWHDGSVHWIKVIGQYLYDSSGKAISLSGIVIDITDRVEYEHKLKTSEEHLRTLIEQAPIATSLFVGKDMIIELPNEAMLKVWGKGASVIGMPLREALPELDGQPFLGILDRIFNTGEPHTEQGARADLIVNGALGTYYYDYTYKPLRNSKGEIYAILDMAIDVTEQVKSREELKKSEERYRQLASELEQRVDQRTAELHQANAELIISNNNLQQFAYAASHDMQEPLRKIQSFGSRLQNVYASALDENGVFMLNRIQDASKRMTAMIDDLLAYSRLTTREIEFKNVSLDQIVQSVLADLEISIQEQQTQIQASHLGQVWGSSIQIAQLLQNLISNAIKYKQPNQISHIKISTRAAVRSEIPPAVKLLEDHQYVRLEVSDNGIGFDETHLDKIFQMFQRLHGRSEYSGSGIGLALCKKVVQNHHGYITAKSVVGQGSDFLVYLPLPR